MRFLNLAGVSIKGSQRCKWYAGSVGYYTADGAQHYVLACLTYKPTEDHHPTGWRYAVGPYSTRKALVQALHIPGASVVIQSEQRRTQTPIEGLS